MIMERIYKTSFSAAHVIKGHPKCGKTHGHNYHLVVKVSARHDEWIDFAIIKRAVWNVLDEHYDHRDLGPVTAEELAIDICRFVKNELHVILSKEYVVNIELWETDNFGVQTNFTTTR